MADGARQRHPLVEKSADDQSPKLIDAYRVEGGKTFKLDPQCVLFSLQRLHNAVPPVFDLLLCKNPRHWVGAPTES